MTPQVRVGGASGIWLSSLAPVGGISVDTRWPLGGYQLDFDVLLGPRKRPAVIAGNATCDLIVGGRPTFTGQISEVDWTDGKVTAEGMTRGAESIPALSSDLSKPTSTPDTAIDTAIALGWPVTRPSSISATPLAAGDSTSDMFMTAALLDLWANDNGQRWYVDPSGAVRAGVDPTVPELYVLPGAGELSWAVEQQATRVIGSWIDAGGRTRVTTVGSGTTVRSVDLSNRGVLNSTQATNILNQILIQATSGSWVGGITVAAGQIITPGGLHPSLAKVTRMVGRGLMIRLLGHRDPRPGRFSLVTDVVIGQAVWSVDDGTIQLTPIGTVARDFAAIVESFSGSVVA